jgi:hypothetical protein
VYGFFYANLKFKHLERAIILHASLNGVEMEITERLLGEILTIKSYGAYDDEFKMNKERILYEIFSQNKRDWKKKENLRLITRLVLRIV